METSGKKEWVNHKDLLEFYSSSRLNPVDLYESEKRFLPWLANKSKSVLDIGCAMGGFADIWKSFNPDIEYAGMDISGSLVDAARILRPDCKFIKGDVTAGIDMPGDYADVAQALGWLHWEPDYSLAISEIYRLAGKWLFFDMRLSTISDRDQVARQKIAFAGEWDGRSTTPYIVASWKNFARLLTELRPKTILGYGYMGKPASTVIGGMDEVCFATFVVEKMHRSHPDDIPTACLAMPFAWPQELLEFVNLRDGEELTLLAPEPQL